jgi:hypothetical protein
MTGGSCYLSNAPAEWLSIRVAVNARVKGAAVVYMEISSHFRAIRAVVPLTLSETYRCVNKIPVRHF